jgi:hypothetical protein
MAGTLSFLSTKFPNYNRAAIGYARLVEILANQKFIAGLKAVGVTITDTTGKHLLPFEQVITRLVKKFPDLAKGGLFVQNFFKQFSGQTGFIGARRAFTVAVQDQPGLDRFSRNIPAQAAGLVNASATALSKTGEVKLKELKTQFQALIITLGQGAIPAFVSLAKPVEAIINWFNGLGTSTKHAIGYFITMSAILGVLVGSLAIVGGSIASMVSTFMLWRLASQAAALGTAELSTEVGILGDTVGAVEVELAPLLAGLALLALLGKALATAAPTVVGHTRGTSGLSSTNIVTSNGVRYIQQPGGGRLTRAPRGAITTQEAASAHAINQAVADSPRYQHAIGANQKAVNAFTKALQMEAAAQRISNAIDRETGVTGSLKVRSVQGWIALIEKAKTAAAKNPFDIQAQKRMEGAEALLNAQFKNQPVLLAAINDVLGAYNDQVQQATDSTKTLGTTFQDVLQGVMSMYNTFLGQEQSAMGELFSGPFVNTPRVQNRLQWGGMLTGKDLLKDEMASLSRFHAFHAQLNQLRGKGAPAELIKELMAKGPDGVMRTDAFGRQRKSLIQELIGLSPADRKKYFDGIRAQTKATQNAALADLKDQLKIYRQHGRNIAIAIVAGLRDENVAMTNAITGMIKNMFPGLPVGNTGAGGKPGHKAPPHIPHPAASGKTGDQHTHYHVTVPGKDASIKTQLKHAHFVNKNRYTNRGKGQFPGTR